MNIDDESLTVRIRAREEVATDILSLTLVATDATPLPKFDAGAHIDVHVEPGLVRQYSLVNDPRECGHYRIGVLRDPQSRGGSEAIHRSFAPGQIIRISKPRCNFPLVRAAKSSILIAGGIGVTPLISMAHALHSENKDFVLHYCCKAKDRVAFFAELQSSGFASRIRVHLDDGPAEQRFVPEDCLRNVDADTHIYICGPAGFISFVTESAKKSDWQPSQIHVEHFKSEVSNTGASFTVRAERSGIETVVQENQTIAQALADVGVMIPISCEQGVCGTCLTRVIDGQPDHRDIYQTDEEKNSCQYITPCCSRSHSQRLVLDL